MYLIFVVHKLAKLSSNCGDVDSEGLEHLLSYIWDNNNLSLNYYSDKKDLPLSDLLKRGSIKTENKLIPFSYSSWKDFPYNGIIKGVYIIFYHGGTVDHVIHVTSRYSYGGSSSN